MQAYRSTSLALSSGSKICKLQQTVTSESTTSSRLSSTAIQGVSRQLHSNVDKYLPPSHLLPSRGLQQQQSKLLFLESRAHGHHLSFSTRLPHSLPARGPTLSWGSRPPHPSRPFSSSVAIANNSNHGKAHSEFQRFLRQKGVDYSETPSCLK